MRVVGCGYIINVYELDLTPIGERQLQLPIRIGRSSLNDVCVSHRLISEFHARIEETDGKLCVRDLSSKNGVLVEGVGGEAAARVAAQMPIELEPYGYEFLLSPLLRVRVRPASEEGELGRQSRALGSVLGNVAFAVSPTAAMAEDEMTEGFAPPKPDVEVAPPRAHAPPAPALTGPLRSAVPERQPRAVVPSGVVRPIQSSGEREPPSASRAVQPYASVFIEPSAVPLDPLPVPPSARPVEVAHVHGFPTTGRVTHPSATAPAARHVTVVEPSSTQPIVPAVVHTAWEVSRGTLPVPGSARPTHPQEPASHSLEALALSGLRELAASLVPGQSVESPADIGRLVTKLHDALEMFCRCFIPVREACARFIAPEELEREAIERCRNGSSAYLAVERALEPRAVAGALLDWRNGAHDAPLAVEHILADLMRHHLAFSQAALEGTRALLDELSPARIEAWETRSPSVLERLGLGGGRDRLLWEAFVARHAQLDGLGRSFRELFGEEFRRALVAHYFGVDAP